MSVEFISREVKESPTIKMKLNTDHFTLHVEEYGTKVTFSYIDTVNFNYISVFDMKLENFKEFRDALSGFMLVDEEKKMSESLSKEEP